MEDSTKELIQINQVLDTSFFLKRVAGQIVPKSDRTKSAPKTTSESVEVDKYQLSIIDSMPKKPGEVARQLFKRGVHLHKELDSGRNPYHGMRPAFMSIACDLLMKGGFNREELRSAMLAENVGVSSIESYCSIACSVLVNLSVASLISHRYTLKERT